MEAKIRGGFLEAVTELKDEEELGGQVRQEKSISAGGRLREIPKGRKHGARKATSRSVLGASVQGGIEQAFRAAQVPRDLRVLVRGRGFLLKAFVYLCRDPNK